MEKIQSRKFTDSSGYPIQNLFIYNVIYRYINIVNMSKSLWQVGLTLNSVS